MKLKTTLLLLALSVSVALLSLFATQRDALAQFKAGSVLTASALNAALAAPTIVAGTINGASIGATNPSTGQFTTLQALGTTTIAPSGTVTISPNIVGTMDNVVIGSMATPVAASFSTLTVGGTVVGILSGTTPSLGGSPLTAGNCSSTTVAVAGSSTAMVAAATPITYPGDAFFWKANVSTPGTVQVKICSTASATPTASAYNVRVIQ